ncbi:hypothetical protein OG21DRAFT_1269414 [Imleria badia]|nr:hypothetical protein OG21DRAFT_1269414 [Imleria badia]
MPLVALLNIVNTVDGDVHMTRPIITWISDFLQRSLSTPENGGVTIFPTPLVREWAKLKLKRDSWRDALVSVLNFAAPRFTIYHALCDHL